MRWLDMAARDAAAIYLVGDLFDFWFEYRHAIPRGFIRLQGKLAELADAGLPIYIFTGNHDLWMFDYFTEELGIPILRRSRDAADWQPAVSHWARRWPGARRPQLQGLEKGVHLRPGAVALRPAAPQPGHRPGQRLEQAQPHPRHGRPTPSISAKTSGYSCTAARWKPAGTTTTTCSATATCRSTWPWVPAAATSTWASGSIIARTPTTMATTWFCATLNN
ncbi:MAG: hypothetical protein WKG07_20180 [Hymenobacter sp.]